ncbi:tRNA dihydrouridine(20/20a) synthase DusA [Spiribacter aquaticus]|uniref:tRNA-dihydrouridine(20/20a) synthase n=1 Tax=Spiribacter aquaticus TaxID=1935996 RepID=A0A557RKJ3_9GAMM|nr:tRNA dihydrouridine synthase DusA [Spiribacter roseus]TVO65688.1 tRNA dihydrouridine(20/20a) synthase DusA [Spiribacter aquaticus]
MRTTPGRALSVAPMMDWTDPACRYLLRLITRRTLLYTEMVPAQALWYGRAERFLKGHPTEAPVALQLGGSDPAQLAYGAALASEWGYDEVNLNVGCPSDRVQSGRFGACLMREPQLVGELVAAMREATQLPVTVKSRIGVDDMDDYAALQGFVAAIVAAGCDGLTVHARKAWLQGLSPKQNREVPPLRYARVSALKDDFPALPIVLNGGIRDLDTAVSWLDRLDGVMIGREAYHNPWLLAAADARVFGEAGTPPPEREAVARAYRDYVARHWRDGVPVTRFTRHLSGLFQGLPGARIWRRALSEGGAVTGAGPEVIDQALAARHRAVGETPVSAG